MIRTIATLLAVTVTAVCAASLDTLYFKQDTIVCPDGHWTCDDQSTCCALPDGEWSCCVFAHAQCCSDHFHCCPQGSTCDVVHKSCNSIAGNHTIPAMRTTFSRSADFKTETVDADSNTETGDDELVKLTCPDRSVCPYAGSACCRQYTGRYSCCNYPLNVCCDDGLHCCHVGTVCDPIHNVCIPYPNNGNSTSGTVVKAVRRQLLDSAQLAAPPVQVVDSEQSTVCPGGDTECPNGSTCCPATGEQWGCCSLPSAVCCADMKHCCPQGTYCTGHGTCASDNLQNSHIPWSAVNFDNE